MEKIPTAEEWLLNHKEMSKYDVEDYDEGGYLGVNEGELYKIMIEFAKLHVEAALKEASKKTTVEYTDKKFSETDMYEFAHYTWKNSPNTHPLYLKEILKKPNETVDRIKKDSILRDSILNSYPLEKIK
jgi:hypothetical protein